MWASLQAISFDFFSSHPAMAPAYFDFFVWTPGKKTGTYIFHQVRAQAGSEQLLHPKKNNTRNLSANYLYRFNSWLISSSVRNIVSVFATAKQLMFLWFQLYSNSQLFTTKYKLCYKKWYKFYRSARGSARYALVCCYISCPMEAWNEWTL